MSRYYSMPMPCIFHWPTKAYTWFVVLPLTSASGNTERQNGKAAIQLAITKLEGLNIRSAKSRNLIKALRVIKRVANVLNAGRFGLIIKSETKICMTA